MQHLSQLEQGSMLNNLPHQGILHAKQSGYCYLSVDPRFIELGFNDIDDPNAHPPTQAMGAHISVRYPEEVHAEQHAPPVGTCYNFQLIDIVYADIRHKRYYAIRVQCPELIALRRAWQLPEKLSLYGHLVDPHITIAKRSVT